MPQIKKYKIKEKIIKNATEEFYKNGFKFTKMSTIAKKSEIPTGLIYTYFKNKEDLFKEIVSPIAENIDYLMKSDNNSNENRLFNEELPKMIDYIDKYHIELVILIDKSMGSLFENSKNKIIEEVSKHLKKDSILKETKYDDIIYHIFSTNFMEGIFEIARHYINKKWAKEMLEILTQQHFYGISGLKK